MTLTPLDKIFNIKYGTQLDLNKMTVSDSSSINFVSRSSQNLGIMCQVEKLENKSPLLAGTITVTLGGSYLLSAFIQPSDFYTAQNIKVLTQNEELSFKEKAFYCLCISSNRYRYNSHGREANTTLDTILVPDRSEIPDWVYTTHIDTPNENPLLSTDTPTLDTSEWKSFKLNDDKLFEITGSKTTPKDTLIEQYGEGIYPYVTTQATDNGIDGFYDYYTEEGNVLTVDSAVLGYCSYQEYNFSASDHVEKLIPKFVLNKYIGLFLATIINQEQYRFNYGRKASQTRLKELSIKLPVDKKGNPDWDYMENYIKSLPYSGSI